MARPGLVSVVVAASALAVLLASIVVLTTMASRTLGWSDAAYDRGRVPSGWPQTAPQAPVVPGAANGPTRS